MKLLPKVMLTTTLVGILGLSGLAARASVKNSQGNLVISQHFNATQLAEVSDGDGEMNDALENQLENKTSQGNVRAQATTFTETSNLNQANQTGKMSESKNDRLGQNDTQEGSETTNDADGGKNEDLETH
jgi:hypothetical protein